jgi:type II secretory pathway pseudopilin PulG
VSRTRGHRCAGSSLIEMLVVLLLLGVILAVVHGSVIAQMRAYATQTVVAEGQFAARQALRVLSDQIAMAGFGIPIADKPSSVSALVTAAPTKLSFWTNVRAEHTFLTASALRDATTVTVLSTAALPPGTSVYISDSTNWYLGTVQKSGGTSVVLSPGLTYNLSAGSLVTPVEQVTFALQGDTLLRNGRAFIRNVRALAFTYDAEKLAAIRTITVRLTVETRSTDVSTGKPIPIAVSAPSWSSFSSSPPACTASSSAACGGAGRSSSGWRPSISPAAAWRAPSAGSSRRTTSCRRRRTSSTKCPCSWRRASGR